MVERLLGKKVIGIKQATKSLKNGNGKVLYVARDCEVRLVTPVIELAESMSVEIRYIDSMKELGRLCGINVGASTALILKGQNS
ncbi:ribosomal L7Ae/L30e/S12e/Gadd45 family protein [Clostridium oryzae]|nr:ribosomal L7Ae/L30e/S12e/Gadd45 family protein [Clostridium oryzae]